MFRRLTLEGKRKLADWITKSEYLNVINVIKLLDSYRMITAMTIF